MYDTMCCQTPKLHQLYVNLSWQYSEYMYVSGMWLTTQGNDYRIWLGVASWQRLVVAQACIRQGL
jgi:hypothetical protein